MPDSYFEYTNTPTDTSFTFPFRFIALGDVHVLGFNEATSVYTNLDSVADVTANANNQGGTVTLPASWNSGNLYNALRIYRATSTTQLVDFENGSRLTATDLDNAYQQSLYVAQEVTEDANTFQFKLQKDLTDTALTNIANFSHTDLTGDGTATVFDLTFTPATNTPEAYIVSIDGAVQAPDAYEIEISSPSTIKFTSTPPNGSVITVVTLASSNIATTVDNVTLEINPLNNKVSVKDGAITQDMLSASIVSEAKLIDGSVTETKLGTGSVTEAKLGTGSVTEAKLGTGSVTVDKLGTASVTETKLGTGSVTETKLGTGSVTETKLGDGSVTAVKLGTGSVTEGKLGTGSVTEGKLGTGSVTETKLGDGSVTETKLGTESVTEGKLETGSVTETKLGTGSVTETKLGTQSVTEGKLGTGSVTETKLGTASVTEDKLGTGSVTEAKLGTGSVTEAKLGTGSVTETKLADGSVTEAKLGTGSVTEAKLGTGSVTEDKLGTGSVTEDKLGTHSVTANKLATSSVLNSKLGALSVTTTKLGTSSVTETKLASNSVTTTKVKDSAITADKLSINELGNYLEWDKTTGHIRLGQAPKGANIRMDVDLRGVVSIGSKGTDTDLGFIHQDANSEGVCLTGQATRVTANTPDLTVKHTGDIDVANKLIVGDDTSITGKVTTTGDAIIGGKVNATGNVVAGATVKGNKGIFETTLQVKGDASLEDELTVESKLKAKGDLVVGGEVRMGAFGGSSAGLVLEEDRLSMTTNSAGIMLNRLSDGNSQVFKRSGTAVGNIAVTTSATSYNTSSDYRLKESLQDIEDADEKVLSLKPINFKWKVSDERVDGFLAHEVQAVVPEAVTGEKDGEEMQSIDQSKLVPLLTAALQDALKSIKSLEERVTALES